MVLCMAIWCGATIDLLNGIDGHLLVFSSRQKPGPADVVNFIHRTFPFVKICAIVVQVFPRLQDYSPLLVTLVETSWLWAPDLTVHFGTADMLREESTRLFKLCMLVVLGQ